jgi:hypothetical protein
MADDPFAQYLPAAPAAPSGDPFAKYLPAQAKTPAAPKFNIDFSKPVEEVRAEVAKLPDDQRQEALKQWADAYVAKERGGTEHRTDLVRNIARGTIAGSWADEMNALTAAGLHKVSGGKLGAPYDEAVAYQRATDRAIDQDLGLGSTVGQLAGAFGTGAPIAKAIIGSGKGLLAKTALSSGVGGGAAYSSALGNAEGDLGERNDAALGALPVGMTIGAAIPGGAALTGKVARAAYDVASPTLARLGASISEKLPRKIGLPAMSADGATPETAGARAAAEQTVANWLATEGVPPGQIPERMRQIVEATKYHTSGQAQDASALVDMTPGLQRLGRAVATRSQDANTQAKQFLEARQTGLTPPGTTADDMAARGLPTRERFAEPIKGSEATDLYGTNFGAGNDNIVPMGQGERYIDALKRAFRIKDSELHGHADNAASTADAIVDAARAEAQPAYNALYKAGQSIDVSSAVAPAIQKWRAIIADPASAIPGPIKAAVGRQITQLFAPNGKIVSNIETFDRAKQLLDDRISALLESPRAPQRQLSRGLMDLKNDLIKGVTDESGKVAGGIDNIAEGNLGPLYKETRGKFSSRMEAKEALEAGKQAAEVGGQQGIKIFDAAATTPGNEKLARLGVLGHVEGKIGGMKHGADKSAIFDTPNMNQFLAHAIERSSGANAPFANRPERFGQFVDLQKGQAETRNMVQGGSPTARIESDVNSFDILSKWQELKNSSSATMAGIKYAAHLLNRTFGLQADTAAQIAQNLFTANKAQQARFVAAVEQRLGRDRAAQFTQLMNEYQRQATSASARQAGNQGNQ